MNTFTDDLGQTVVDVHRSSVCAGRVCMIHNPSDHHMRSWPLGFRADRMPLAERFCPHGVGHPDPDCVAFLGEGWGVHGCDGCCRP